MMFSSFQYPSRVIIEPEGYLKFTDYLDWQPKRLFVVMGKGALKAADVSTKLQAAAKNANIAIEFHEGISTNPSNLEADNAAAHCMEFDADAVMGLGGGSSLDIAKIVAMLATNSGKSWDYISMTGTPGRKVTKRPLPLLAIPTTSGTGSETTPYAVITHAETRMKKGMGSQLMYPELVILDPTLLALMPPRLVAITGLDAFGQALEGYTSGKSTIHSEHFGWSALEYIGNNLKRSYDQPGDLEAKAGMAWGSALSGLSIGLVDVNLAHAMSHPLSGHYDIQHGLGVAMCTPAAIDYNRAHVGDKYIKVAALFGYEGKDKNEAADVVIANFYSMCDYFGLNLAMSAHAPESDIPMIATDAFEVGAIRTNPRDVALDDLPHLFHQVWRGHLD